MTISYLESYKDYRDARILEEIERMRDEAPDHLKRAAVREGIISNQESKDE